MKKQLKVGLLSTLAGLAVVTAASCGGTAGSSASSNASGSSASSSNASSSSSSKKTTLNVAVNYSQQSGISYQEANAAALTYGEGITLTKGDILPTWKCIGEKLNVTITDGADYSKAQKDNWTQYVSEGFKDANGTNIDLVMGTQTLYDTAVAKNGLVAISDHLNEMPNFKAWTQKNKSIWQSMKSTDGKVYYTPYFDGKDDIEKMNIMNVEWIQKLLDGTEAADTATTIQSYYKATIPAQNGAQVLVWTGSERKSITVNYSDNTNAISMQNKLANKNGESLLKALKESLIAQYGDYISTSAGGKATGSDVIYNSLSEIFTTEKACYNVDDLVALIRCVKTNPGLLTGDATKKINPIIPRGSKTSRQYSIGELASWWGVRGISGENGGLYFDLDGEIQDGHTKDATYDALNNLHSIYQEGLIYQGYASKDDNNTEDKYRKSGMYDGSVFMIYEYNSSTTQYNADADEANKSGLNLQAVLPPVAKWAGSDSVQKNGVEYSGYFHFSEDNRALKTGGWAIPTSTTGEKLTKALELMDYMFSEEGSLIQDFGPDTKYTTTTSEHKAGEYVYWTPYAESTLKLTLNGVEQPEITEAIKKAIQESGLGWNNYYRKYVGSTQGIGHIRHGGLDFECLFSEKGKAGLQMLSKAMEDNVLCLVTTEFSDDTDLFCNSMLTGIPVAANVVSVYESDTSYKMLTDFWNNSKSKVVWTGTYVIMNDWTDENVVSICKNYNTLKSNFAQYNNVYTNEIQKAFDSMGIVEK